MKRYLSCTLLSLTLFGMARTQDNARSEMDHISAPYYKITDGFTGKNFFFENNWVKAKILTANNNVVSNDSFLYNFDKIDRRLLITTDFKNISEIDWREFKAVMFYTNDTTYILEHIYLISNKDLFQVLIKGDSKYSLYKTVHTKVIKGIYGATSYGKSPDRYQDITEYCIFFPNREYRTFYQLKRSAIERIFKLNPDSGRVEEYLNSIGKNTYQEDDLKQLILYLNRQSL